MEVTANGRGWSAFLMLLAVAFVVRTAFFFDSVVGWDETTFILMGQSVLDGFVPYRDYWDLKPPLVYFAFALIDLLGLHTVVGVRIVGTVLVALTAFAVFVLARRFASRGVALTVAAVTICLMSALVGGMATLTETVAMPLWMAALVLLARPAPTRTASAIFLSGLLLSLATLMRLNLAYGVVTTAAALAAVAYREAGVRSALRASAWLALGGAVPLAATVVYFALRSDLASVWQSTVEAPLAYANGQFGPVRVLTDYARLAFRFPPALLVCAAVAACIALLPRVWKSLTHEGRLAAGFALASAAGIWYSIVIGGNAYPHYLMQLVPPLALPTAAALHWLGSARAASSWSRRAVSATLGVGAAIGLYPTFAHLPVLADRVRTEKTLFADEGYRLTKYLEQHLRDGDSLLLMDRHIAYWDTRRWPPTKILHPSNFDKAYMLPEIEGVPPTPEALMQDIMSKKPTVVVAPDEIRYLDDGSPVEAVLRRALAADYRLETTIDTLKVFRRARS